MRINIGDTTHNCDPASLEFIGFGDTGIVYKAAIDGQEYALKFHRDQALPFRMTRILNKVSRKEKPSALAFRSFPVGIGTAQADEIGREGMDFFVMAFNWVEGRKLEDILDDLKYADKKLRKKQAKALLKALRFFEECNLVHSDISPRNILMDGSGKFHLIDIESSGLIHSKASKQWTFTPRTFGTRVSGFPRAPEHQQASDSFYVDRWSVAQLVAFILSAYKPFGFLKVINFKSLEKLVKIAENSKKSEKYSWPPLGAENHPMIYENYDFDTVRTDFVGANSNGANSNIPSLLYETFISGFTDGKKRPNAREWLARLGM